MNATSKRLKRREATWAGFDLSTTGLALGVRSRAGDEAYVQTKMRGGTRWQGQPAFDLTHVPGMIVGLFETLAQDGWSFADFAMSFSVRQHDMVLLDEAGRPLMPALSWQCHAASQEVARLREQGAEAVVGRIEERFILPKLMWALSQTPSLADQVRQVMTTGDWIAYLLTGRSRLSTSDALSNGLLQQKNKKLAANVMKRAGLDPRWFPPVLQSGSVVGRVTAAPTAGADAAWTTSKQLLPGATVVAGLGDNHATGVGCGLDEHDFQTIVVSAGTSGTINRVCPPQVPLVGQAACFEYYQNRLLLMMLADCCKWYDRFVARFAAEYVDRLGALNELAAAADLSRLRRVLHRDGKEHYAPDWSSLSLGEQVASTQWSIMVELLLRVRAMQAEVVSAETPPVNYVLTGGLSQSEFFQQVFQAGVQLLAPVQGAHQCPQGAAALPDRGLWGAAERDASRGSSCRGTALPDTVGQAGRERGQRTSQVPVASGRRLNTTGIQLPIMRIRPTRPARSGRIRVANLRGHYAYDPVGCLPDDIPRSGMARLRCASGHAHSRRGAAAVSALSVLHEVHRRRGDAGRRFDAGFRQCAARSGLDCAAHAGVTPRCAARAGPQQSASRRDGVQRIHHGPARTQ